MVAAVAEEGLTAVVEEDEEGALVGRCRRDAIIAIVRFAYMGCRYRSEKRME